MSQTNVFFVRVYCLDLPFAVGDGYYRRGEGAVRLVGYVIEPWFRGCMVASSGTCFPGRWRFFFHAQHPLVGQGLLITAASRSHSGISLGKTPLGE